MKKLTLVLGVALSASSFAAGACSSDPATADGEGGSGGVTGDPPAALMDSPFVARAELERITRRLAADDFAGRNDGTPGGALARQYLIDELTKCGVAPGNGDSFEQAISAPGALGTNIIGMVKGTDPTLAERTILLSAHYDHIGVYKGATYKGANDNAAGVAMVAGVGCALAAAPRRRSVLIVFWDAEEPPTFLTAAMGSQFYAANPVVPLEQTDVVIALDLVGGSMWPGFDGHFYLGAEHSPQVQAAVQRAATPEGLSVYHGGLHLAEEQPLGIGRQPWSDYDAFRNLQKPVLFLSNGQNKQYHTPADEADGLEYARMELEGKYLLRVVDSLASAEETPEAVSNPADYATDAATVKRLLEASLGSGGLASSLGLSAASSSKLEADLVAVDAMVTKLEGGDSLTDGEIRALRDGTQRIMCYAGSSYPEATCNAF